MLISKNKVYTFKSTCETYFISEWDFFSIFFAFLENINFKVINTDLNTSY